MPSLHGRAVRSIFVDRDNFPHAHTFHRDIVGAPGRQIVQDRLADIVAQRQIDLVIANGENSASGFGITPRLADDLLGMGIEVLTGGNHSWDRKEILEYLPHSRAFCGGKFPRRATGTGTYVGVAKNGVKFAILNLQGRVFMTPSMIRSGKRTPNLRCCLPT